MKEKTIELRSLSVRSASGLVLNNISLKAQNGLLLAIIGPAGSGKTTLLKAMNRMIEFEEGLESEGDISLNEKSVYWTDLSELRRKIGIVFSVPTPLPLSIYDNLAFGPKLHGAVNREVLAEKIERSLKAAYLWEEVKDRFAEPASNLSGGQQQRLCLARTLMLEPEILLLDEPTSGLDPISTAKIEAALTELKKDMAIIFVTNNVKQASRFSDETAFLLMGDLIEYGTTHKIFTAPADRKTEDYITGRFG